MPLGRGPDQLVDLVHLPQLVAGAERRPGGEHDVGAGLDVVAAVHPTLDRRRDEPRRQVHVGGIVGQAAGVGPDRVLEHADADVLVGDDVEVLRRVELAGIGVHGLEHLGVLVVGHRLGGVDAAVEQTDHVEVLGDERDVGCRDRGPPAPRAAKISYSLPKPQLPIVLPAKSAGRGDAGIGERHLQRARALEDLGDVGDVGARLTAGECLRHPCDREVGVAVGELRLRHDLDATFEDLEVDALLLVEALVEGGVVAGEL